MLGGQSVCVLFSILLVAAMSQSSEDETTGTSQSSESPDETTGGTTGSSDNEKVLQDYDKFVAVATTKSSQRNDSCGTVAKNGSLERDPTSGKITQAYEFNFRYAGVPFAAPANITAYPNGTFIVHLELPDPFKPAVICSTGIRNLGLVWATGIGRAPLPSTAASWKPIPPLEFRLVENTGGCFILERVSTNGTYQYSFANASLPEDKMKECRKQLGQNATFFEICKEK